MTLAIEHFRRPISPIQFGAQGDGIADDTVPVQRALTYCSDNGLVCMLPFGSVFRITSQLFMWGNCHLYGPGTMSFDNPSYLYLISIGIRSQLIAAPKFTGEVAYVNFVIPGTPVGFPSGRILFFFRTEGAVIHHNVARVGAWKYSLTSSNNDANWLAGAQNYIRKTITVHDNAIYAEVGFSGSEGYGFGFFDGIDCYNNFVDSVGDDVVGIHFCTNFVVRDNTFSSTDGRIYISNSQHGEIYRNRATRVASKIDGSRHVGTALIYLGHEQYVNPLPYAACEDIWIHDNHLEYTPGSIDAGSALYIYAPRDVTIENNTIVNNSAEGVATGCHLLTAGFSGTPWADPTGLDGGTVGRVYETTIINNKFIGSRPLGMLMTGSGLDFIGPVEVAYNTAASFSYYGDNVNAHDNITAP